MIYLDHPMKVRVRACFELLRSPDRTPMPPPSREVSQSDGGCNCETLFDYYLLRMNHTPRQTDVGQARPPTGGHSPQGERLKFPSKKRGKVYPDLSGGCVKSYPINRKLHKKRESNKYSPSNKFLLKINLSCFDHLTLLQTRGANTDPFNSAVNVSLYPL